MEGDEKPFDPFLGVRKMLQSLMAKSWFVEVRFGGGDERVVSSKRTAASISC